MDSRYKPVFAGETEDNEKIVIYEEIQDFVGDQDLRVRPRGGELSIPRYHIIVGNGDLKALSPGGEITVYEDVTNRVLRLTLVSEEWSGKATGTKWDLMQLPNR